MHKYKQIKPYQSMKENKAPEGMEIGYKNEVREGTAKILCTIDGETPKLYDCIIKKRSASFFSKTQNLTVEITDKELIEKKRREMEAQGNI